MKKLISVVLVCILISSFAMMAGAKEFEIPDYKISDNISAYLIETETGKSTQITVIDAGLSQEELAALSDAEFDAIVQDYFDSLPQTRAAACVHNFVLKSKAPAVLGGIPCCLAIYECSKCNYVQFIYMI